jgi:alanine racemase
MPRPTWAEIDLDALRHNLGAIRERLAPGVRVMGIVKANAYGHGAVTVGRTLADAGIDMLGVALVEEGLELREAGVRVPILMMGLAAEADLAAALAADLTLTVDGAATAEPVERAAAGRGEPAAVHLKIDTGMNRLGVRAEEAAQAAADVDARPHLRLDGAYTHFACADADDDAVTPGQVAAFAEALKAMRAASIDPPLVHAANSAALLARPEAHFGMVRSGLALYGVPPSEAAKQARLRPVLTLKSRVAALKRVRAGEGVSYGHRWRAERDALVGVLPIGYADGYPRALSGRATVRAAGRLVPVVGTVCMDLAMVDLTDVPEAEPGLEVTLLEADNASPLSASALAEAAGTIPYEILAGIGLRVPRVYRG